MPRELDDLTIELVNIAKAPALEHSRSTYSEPQHWVSTMGHLQYGRCRKVSTW
ncbi:MAG: hypothetical protein GU355_04375 [Caldivirga sp.]|jgi:hypothetical protein|nr:hypothetical protein [Caldivirga sp.]